MCELTVTLRGEPDEVQEGDRRRFFALLRCVRWKGVEAGFVYFKAELPSL